MTQPYSVDSQTGLPANIVHTAVMADPPGEDAATLSKKVVTAFLSDANSIGEYRQPLVPGQNFPNNPVDQR